MMGSSQEKKGVLEKITVIQKETVVVVEKERVRKICLPYIVSSNIGKIFNMKFLSLDISDLLVILNNLKSTPIVFSNRWSKHRIVEILGHGRRIHRICSTEGK